MSQCKHEWRLIIDDTGGAFRFCSICEQSEHAWMNAKPNQCKDCRHAVEAFHVAGRFRCDNIKHFHLGQHVPEDQAMFIDFSVRASLYVLPTHGCNAWEKKE